MTVSERTVPHNIEAEEALLGALLIDAEAIASVAPTLHPEDFYRERNGLIYGARVALYNRHEPGDFVTVCDELERQGKLQEVGGASYLASLVNAAPTAAHAEHYARIIERCAVMRRLITAAGRIAGIGYEEPADVDQALDRAEQILFDVSQRRISQDFVPLHVALKDYFDRIDYLHQHKGEIVGVATGFSDLDRLTTGLHASDLIIVAGRPAVGKTAFCLSIARNAAVLHHTPVALFSLEMSVEQLVQRLLCAEANVDAQRLRSGYIDEFEWHRISEAFGTLSEAPVFIDDSANVTTLEVRAKARRLKAEHNIGLIMIDYLQLMQGRGLENRVQEVSEISRGLKGLARELDVPVIALSQLSRAVESRQDHRPVLSDLRESGCLAGDSLVYLPDEGAYRRIDQLAGRSGFNILALNTETWQLERRPVLRAFATGHKWVYRLTTRLGRSIRATGNHQFLTIQGWRRLYELKAGDRLALPRRLTGPETATMSDAEVSLLGHLIGDGCTLPRQPIHYTTSDPMLAETVADLATKVFGDAVAPRISREREWYQVYLSAGYHLTHGVRNPVAAWLDGMGVFGLRSYEKRVPEVLFGQPRGSIARFLRHLWATDGCIHLSHGVAHYAAVYYATSSAQLARDTQSLLLRLGVNATVSRHTQRGKGRDQYHVSVSGRQDIESFFAQVGSVGGSKESHQAAIADYLQDRPANTNRDVLPRDTWRLVVVPAMQAVGLTTRQMQAALGTAYCGSGLYKSNIGRERARRVAQVVQSDELARLADSDVYWDEIVSVTADGEDDVYDLTVEGLHNFVADDVVAHNSIEQDADIVIFIHREELYNPNTERKNIADIIVAKHRNGPMGQVPLRFFPSQTRFADLELYRQTEEGSY